MRGNMNTTINKLASRGRIFERLVEDMERWLGVRGAEIKSPDFLVDRDTGQRREVDVSLRIPTTDGPFLTVVECRDRSRAPDVTWIEQLATKCRSVGANRVVAVSSRPFGQSARMKAHALQVELREVQEITEDIAVRWGRTFAITSSWPHYKIRACRFITDPALAKWVPESGAAARFEKEPFATAIGFDRQTNKPITLSTLAYSAINTYPLFQEDKGIETDPRHFDFELGMAPGRYVLRHADGDVRLCAVKFALDLWWAVPKPVSSRCWAYRESCETVSEYARVVFQLPNGEYLGLFWGKDGPTEFAEEVRQGA